MSTPPTPDRPVFAAPFPGYEERVRESFLAQPFMHTIGARMTRVSPGEVEIVLAHQPSLTQQHGFTHGGVIGAVLDTACGYAALSLFPPEAGVLTVEFKVNFLAPGMGERFRFVGRVRKHGRTLTLVEADAWGVQADGREKLVATLTATMMTLMGRDDVRN